jgi:hypothetical protein
VEWDDDARSAFGTALNEAEVLGLGLDPAEATCDVFVHVLSLPPDGPIDPDPRRILRLFGTCRAEVLLRRVRSRRDWLGQWRGPYRHRIHRSVYGPAIPFADLHEVEAFFDSLEWCHAMRGWRLLDEPHGRTAAWPKKPNLVLDVRGGPGAHTFYWFNDVGRSERGREVSYCIEGAISFDDLAVLRADGSAVSTEEFRRDARAWWVALRAPDERLSVEAQEESRDGAPSWRSFISSSVIIPMKT